MAAPPIPFSLPEMTNVLPGLAAAVWVWQVLLGVALLGTASSTIFLFLLLAAASRYRREARTSQAAAVSTAESSLPPVTILKPVHGMEPRLEENLESFFLQDYPEFEIVISARDADDLGLKVAEQVRRRYPQVKSRIVLSGPPTWPNAKVFSLDKMLAVSSNSYLVLSDSDTRVGHDLLRNLIPSLLNPKVGLVTCPYRGVPAPGFGSTLEALGMSVEMTSGVIVADMMEGMRFALGPVIAIRRDALEGIGGFASVADYYSDDFELGSKVWAAGYKVVLSHYVVGHVLLPRPFWRTVGDQLRWMKSTRFSRPKGHLGTGLTFAMPFGLLGLLASVALDDLPSGFWLFGAAWANRVIQALAVGWGIIRDPRLLSLCWLYPLRDLLGFFIWLASFASRSFFWRGEIYRFSNGGKIVPQDRPAESAVAQRL